MNVRRAAVVWWFKKKNICENNDTAIYERIRLKIHIKIYRKNVGIGSIDLISKLEVSNARRSIA